MSENIVENRIIINDWHALAKSTDLQEKKVLSAVLMDKRIVLWTDGKEIHAMSDTCPHRGAQLSLGKVGNNRIICPYHGWQFDTQGQCQHQPAQPELRPAAGIRVEKFNVQERYGLIWVCPGEPENDIPDIIGLDEDYHLVITGPYDVRTSAPRVIENFLDVAHLPFVHEGLLGDGNHTEIKEYDAELTDQGVQVRNFSIWQPNASSVHTEGMDIEYTYDILRPYSIMLTKKPEQENGKPSDIIFLTVSPMQETNVRAHIIMATTYGTTESESAVHDFQDQIFMQDKDVLESQLPQQLPLEPLAEKHQRSDRASVEYRRWLKELGVTYGTC